MTWETRVRSAIRALANGCASANVQWMLIGGIAVIARGAPRTTQDIDATVLAPGVDVDQLLAAFGLHQIVPRVADVRDMAVRAQILLLRHGEGAIDLDVSLGWLSFEEQAIGRASLVDFGDGLQVPVAQPDDLIVYKSVAWRDQDRQDIERLLLKHRATIDLARVRARVLEFAQLLEVPERIEQFDALVERTRQP